MILSGENYFSIEANREFLSVSQYKNFIGTYGYRGCESRGLAMVNGEWKQEMTPALYVGSYLDAHFEGTLDVFKVKNPEIFRKDGELRSIYTKANEIISRIERDPYFMKYLGGEKQVIFTGEIFGVKWKCKVDSFTKHVCIADIKLMADLRESFWVKDLGYLSFIEYWGYNIQGAIYQKLVDINTGEKLPFYITAASKERYPDIEVIGFTQDDLDATLSLVFPNVNRINDLKLGRAKPDRCEICDYCRATKVLSKPIHYSELVKK